MQSVVMAEAPANPSLVMLYRGEASTAEPRPGQSRNYDIR